MAPLSLFFCAYGLIWAEASVGVPLAIAGGLYFFGCFVLTAFGNVSMNNALDSLDAASEEAKIYWSQTYLPRWTVLNTLRTVACCAAAAVLLFGLFEGAA